MGSDPTIRMLRRSLRMQPTDTWPLRSLSGAVGLPHQLAAKLPASPSGLEDLSSVSSSPTSSPKTKVTAMTSAQKSSQIGSSQLLKRHVQQTEAVLTHKQAQVPISSEQTEEAEKEDLRVQLKRHHPSSPLPGSKTSKRPNIKVSLISQGDTAGGPCTPSQGGVPEGEFFLACLKKLSCLKPHNITLLVTTCCTTKPLLQCKMCLEQRGHAVARGTDMDSDLI